MSFFKQFSLYSLKKLNNIYIINFNLFRINVVDHFCVLNIFSLLKYLYSWFELNYQNTIIMIISFLFQSIINNNLFFLFLLHSRLANKLSTK